MTSAKLRRACRPMSLPFGWTAWRWLAPCSDPLAALVFCQPQRVDLSIINGRIVVEDGQLLTADVSEAWWRRTTGCPLQLIRGES